ncbi:alpha-galactosidase [Microbacterium sp. NEAU-LLC]|uniref:Alpha-galactosidase n=1 Tax=Microbacterium helvum TaxID=2773713 RepID=A0ABR8NN34_9MICO|nr:glycoside hydrolase family 36 protein [Microbacterium helvum]MBD3942072.1 alpha-galactosidase [Microbacterium helvum]
MRLEWSAGDLTLAFSSSPDAPVQLTRLSAGGGPSAVRAHALVDVFTATEQRARTSQAFIRSAVGERLRRVDHEMDAACLRIRQHDVTGGVEVVTTLRAFGAGSAVQWTHTVRNLGPRPLTLTAVSSLVLELADRSDVRVLWGESEWLAEGRWHDRRLAEVLPGLALDAHGQDGRGRFARSSHGSWSSGEFLPTAALVREGGPSLAWQLETSAGWSWELAQTHESVTLSASGPGDFEHQFAQRLDPGGAFTTIPVGLAVANGGMDAVIAALSGYRRALRHRRPIDDELPVIYNDYMNTLMGQPSTEALLPLIDAAADAGAELFCIDAGWFTDASDYWRAIGDWREAPTRFTGGLRAVIDAVHTRGMRSGLWLEPEIVGVESPVADLLPDEAFFRRFGERVVEDHRFHLDLRHPAARAHLDETVDRLVAEFGVGYFKLDYNINPGVGTEDEAAAAGAGLLGHTRALRDWLLGVQERHPEVVFENCASGAMRADYALLSVAHLQSTSDQQDFRRYAPIAASAPANVLPEQAGNWAYPTETMTDAETAYTLVSGLAGRLMLSGFLPDLRPEQRELVTEAVAMYRGWRDRLTLAVPAWPLGLPGWDDDVVALALRAPEETLVCVWSRGDGGEIVVPGLTVLPRTTFPETAQDWTASASPAGLALGIPSGTTARAFIVPHAARPDRF